MTEKHKKTVLPPHMGGGPHGVGDPDSNHLRKVEMDICVPRLMKEAAHDKCADLVEAFTVCGKESGFMLPFKCRPQNKAMQDCLSGWYKNDEFREEITRQYLEERREYRLTGVPVRRYWMGKRITELNVDDLPQEIKEMSDVYRKKHGT